jgi:hypothetical protein
VAGANHVTHIDLVTELEGDEEKQKEIYKSFRLIHDSILGKIRSYYSWKRGVKDGQKGNVRMIVSIPTKYLKYAFNIYDSYVEKCSDIEPAIPGLSPGIQAQYPILVKESTITGNSLFCSDTPHYRDTVGNELYTFRAYRQTNRLSYWQSE